jgi:hypothetical protein
MVKSIPIFDVIEVAPVGSGRPIHTRGTATRELTVVDHSVEQLGESMTNFIEGIQEMLSKGAQSAGEFRMKTVEVQVAIGIEGKIGFLGTGTAASGNSQIKIVFERAT